MRVNKFFKLCLLIAAICSSAYLLVLGWFNMPSLDDWGYIAMAEDEGLFGMIKTAYNGWQCRFSTFFVNGIIYLLFCRASNLVGVTIILLLSGWLIMERLLNGIFAQNHVGLDAGIRIPLAVLLINIGVMSYLEPATFYWLCALNYTLSIWAALLLCYSIFFCSAKGWMRWLMLLVSSLYISGTAENFTPLVLLVLGVTGVVRFLKQRTGRQWMNRENAMIVVGCAIMLAGFLIMLAGPGNAKRIGGDGQMKMFHLSPLGLAIKSVKASAILGLRFVSRSFYYLLLLPVFVGIGALAKGSIKLLSVRHIVMVIGLFFVFFLIAVTACVVGVGWYAPPRAFCYMSFVIMTVFAYLGIRLGMTLKGKKYRLGLASAFAISVALFCVVKIDKDIPVVRTYHNYVALRNEGIVRQKLAVEKGDMCADIPYVCKPFGYRWSPNSYSILRNGINAVLGKANRIYEPYMLLMESELKEDPDDWRNVALKYYYHAPFDIVCKE